jgi:hypothetical protein
MPVILEHSQAFDSGDTLWMLPFDTQSTWYQRLNWLTNFRLTANELHTRPKMHPWLIKILENCEIPTPEITVSDPLLIPVAQWLPAEWLVTIPFATNNEILFIKQIRRVWEQFQQPSLRLFMPRAMTLQRWEFLWEQEKLSSDLTLVFEPSV